MEDLLPYTEMNVSVYGSQMVQVPLNCNGYIAVNSGDAIFWINGFRLLPRTAPGQSGESKGAIGWRREIFKGTNGQLQVVLDKTVGVAPFLQICFKIYI